MTPPDDAAFAELSRQIARGAGLILEAYKDKCVRRRIAVRMRACGVHTYADYRALLERSPEEYERKKADLLSAVPVVDKPAPPQRRPEWRSDDGFPFVERRPLSHINQVFEQLHHASARGRIVLIPEAHA